MVILVIDSVTPVLYVALVKDEKVFERTCEVQKAHDKNLNRLVREVLADSQTLFPDIDAFAVVSGPGSWTGCRVGVVAVKAYAMVCPHAKIIELRATPNKIPPSTKGVESEASQGFLATIKAARKKFQNRQFTTAAELMPYYDGEFKVTLK